MKPKSSKKETHYIFNLEMLVSMKGQDLDIGTGGVVSSYGDISPFDLKRLRETTYIEFVL